MLGKAGFDFRIPNGVNVTPNAAFGLRFFISRRRSM